MKNYLIILALAISAFAADPQPTKQPDTASIEQLQKQVAADKAEIVRLNQLITALREQMQALSAYFGAQEKIRVLDAKPEPSAVSTAAPSSKQ